MTAMGKLVEALLGRDHDLRDLFDAHLRQMADYLLVLDAEGQEVMRIYRTQPRSSRDHPPLLIKGLTCPVQEENDTAMITVWALTVLFEVLHQLRENYEVELDALAIMQPSLGALLDALFKLHPRIGRKVGVVPSELGPRCIAMNQRAKKASSLEIKLEHGGASVLDRTNRRNNYFSYDAVLALIHALIQFGKINDVGPQQ